VQQKSSSERLVPLTAQAADESTEVFITDGRLQRIASGVGRIETEVQPGIYKVRFRAGDTQHDELVEVTSDDPSKLVQGPPVQFQSAVPIENTETSREYHAVPAHNASLTEPLGRGSGSHLFVFARELAERERTMPWTGASIRDLDGSLIAELGEGERNHEYRYGAIHLEVDPGTYCLRVDTRELGTYEMFVTTTAAWQTQVFTVSDDFWVGSQRVRRPSLRTASVLMTRAGQGFDPDSDQLRLTELARQGLESGRNVVRPGDLGTMLWAKYENPMLAIYGAHLMLLQSPINHELMQTVMGNLESLVGPQPDVLSLHLRPGAPTPPRDLTFSTPPMLRDSWDLISRATRRRIGLVPAGSHTDRIADELIGSRPWLLHRVERVVEPSEEPVSVAEATRLLEGLMERASAGEAESMAQVILDRPEEFNPLERSIASVTIGGAMIETSVRRSGDEGATEAAAGTVAYAVRGLDAPATSIARSTKSLVNKLDALS